MFFCTGCDDKSAKYLNLQYLIVEKRKQTAS
jgi:hypothetical protein